MGAVVSSFIDSFAIARAGYGVFAGRTPTGSIAISGLGRRPPLSQRAPFERWLRRLINGLQVQIDAALDTTTFETLGLLTSTNIIGPILQDPSRLEALMEVVASLLEPDSEVLDTGISNGGDSTKIQDIGVYQGDGCWLQ
jgi:hypothetical protein